MKKPRPPTADDYKTLRRLCDAAGNRDILNRWIDAALSAAKQRRGPKSYQYPKSMPIELMYLLAEPGVTRTEAIKQWIRHKDVSGRGTEKSTIAHVNKAFRKLAHVKRYRRPAIVTDLIRARIKSRDSE